MKYFWFALLLFSFANVQAQLVTGISTKWDDEFTEWTLFTEFEDNGEFYEEENGQLILTWQRQRDWSQWNYQFGVERGTIRQKRKDDPSQWEIRGNNEIITAKMAWTNDVRTWKITNNSKYLTLTTRYGNRLDEWILREESHGVFHMYTELENDPRDWIIVDKLDEDISLTMKMALIFVASFNGSPKE